MITLNIHFDSSNEGTHATLFWLAADGQESRYTDIRAGASVQQETFAGHRWVIRNSTGDVLMQIEAAAQPTLQQYTVHEGTAVGAATEQPDGFFAEDEDAGVVASAWVSEDGVKFERLPRIPGRQVIIWRHVDNQGTELGQYEQLEVRNDTHWFWWANPLFSRLRSMSGDREHLLFCAMSVAAAYQLDSAQLWPNSLRLATMRLGLGNQPLIGLLLLLLLLGAMIAAALPICSQSLLLLPLSAEDEEVRLCQGQGFSRAPSRRPGYANPWKPICAGTFERIPPDLRELIAARPTTTWRAIVVLLLAGMFCRVRALAW
eukprot:CAMPEP_0119324620 /NCGR_PEP_ID=MMETSP1333-20130426/63747_1 /TAXON_ID=418940 /ORGANISM="Scyphosphaera apsteinii, Strain RCC1455" /LENGTH=316 /DNA_ID=CAMNT_0007332375 /DNA_START=119 /DNA_END=1069 /DNA_ORIENTATION=+